MKIINESKKLNESSPIEDKGEALAKYLEIDVEDVKNAYGDVYETPDGDYLVVDEDEAREAAEESIESIYDDIGLDSFSENFQEWILDNAVDTDWFDDTMREYAESNVDEMSDEELLEEADSYNILSPSDTTENEDGDEVFSEDANIDGIKETLVDMICGEFDNGAEWYKGSFGDREFSDAVKENDLVDLDIVVEECINVDGVAHFIASYDGDEHDLGDGLFAYRVE